MNALARWLRDERGFTLSELLVTTALFGIVMGSILTLQQQGQQTYLLGSNRVETQQNARVALDLMTRELRSATSITTIAGCSGGACTDLIFVDQNGQTVRYALSGTTLNRRFAGTTTVLIGGVQTLAMTPYSTYDVSTATYTTTMNPAQAKVIKISLTAKTEETVATHLPGDQRATMESMVQLRLGLS